MMTNEELEEMSKGLAMFVYDDGDVADMAAELRTLRRMIDHFAYVADEPQAILHARKLQAVYAAEGSDNDE